MASYAVDYYLQHVNGLNTLVPIHKFRSQRPQYVNKDKVRLQYASHQKVQMQF